MLLGDESTLLDIIRSIHSARTRQNDWRFLGFGIDSNEKSNRLDNSASTFFFLRFCQPISAQAIRIHLFESFSLLREIKTRIIEMARTFN